MKPRFLAIACGLAALGASSGHAEPNDLGAVQRVLRGVHHDLTYQLQTDTRRKWRVEPADRKGDCVSYALTTAKRLEDAGFAPERLQLLILGGYRGQTHAVVLIDGAWVADSMSEWVEPLSSYAGHHEINRIPAGVALKAAASNNPWTIIAFGG